MSNQNTMQSDKKINRRKNSQPSQIDEEAYESDQLGQTKTKFKVATPKTDI